MVRVSDSQGSAIARLLELPRAELGHWPTPLDPVSHSACPGLWVKRDDLSGWGRGGSKTRKIEHLLGHLDLRGYDELITVTGNVTNLVFDLLPAVAARGIRPHVLIVNYPTTTLAERERIFGGAGEGLHFLGRSRSAALTQAVATWFSRRARGRRPFLLLPGAAHPASVAGSASGFLEMAAQLNERAPRGGAGGTVFITVATGTTFAGFLLAAQALLVAGQASYRIIGVPIDRAPLRSSTIALLRWTERALDLPHVSSGKIELVAPSQEQEFALFSPALPALCERVEREHGLRLDPIFGGKTWLVMEQMLARESRLNDRPVLFWHCGYTPEWRTLSGSLHHGD